MPIDIVRVHCLSGGFTPASHDKSSYRLFFNSHTFFKSGTKDGRLIALVI